MAAFLLVFRRAMLFYAFQAIDVHLEPTCAKVEGVQFIEKTKYDEMSLRIRLAEGKNWSAEEGFKVSELKEPALAKLLQMIVTYSALWEVSDGNGDNIRHAMATAKSPTTIRSIE